MRKLILLVALAAIAVLAPAGAASAQRDGSPDDPRAKAFVKEVSVDRVEHHQQRLQDIATANGGTRDMFGPGYTGSLNYVVRVLRNAGYDPEITPFNFPFWEETAPPVPQPGRRPRRRPIGRATAAHSGTPDVRLHLVRRLAQRRRSTTCGSCRSAGS